MHKLCFLLLLVCVLKSGSAQVPLSIIKDINTTPTAETSSDPALDFNEQGWFCAVFNNEIYFTADDSVHGREIWKTDGTPLGTKMLKDINPGKSPSTDGYNYLQMVACNGALFFTVDDGEHGLEIWRTDGTTEGTHMLKELQGLSNQILMVAAGNRLFINVPHNNEFDKSDLYVSDGTAEGTMFVQSFNGLDFPITWNDLVFFTQRGLDSHTSSLWRTDGTASGTYPIVENVPDYETPEGWFKIRSLFPYNNLLYFSSPGTGELFKTDGTVEGTSLVFTFSGPTRPYGFSGTVDGLLYLSFFDDAAVTLWASNGTEAGTHIVHSFPGAFVNSIVEVGDVKYLFVVHGDILPPYRQKELWRTDGTPEGTLLVKDQGNYSNLNDGLFDYNHAVRNGKLIFEAKDDEHGEELWISDGTVAGTQLYVDQTEGPSSTERYGFYTTATGDYFQAKDENDHFQLYKIMDDCPVALLTESTSEERLYYLQLNERFCVSAALPGHGRELLYYDVSHDPSSCLVTPVEQPLTKNVSIYPNPAKEKLLHLHAEVPVSWKLLDLYGHAVMQGEKNAGPDEMLDARHLSSGCYVLKAMTHQGVTTEKVIIK